MSPATRSLRPRPRIVVHACLSAVALFVVAGLVSHPGASNDTVLSGSVPNGSVPNGGASGGDAAVGLANAVPAGDTVVTPVMPPSAVTPRPTRMVAPRSLAPEHFTVAPQAITDAQGTVWQPSAGVHGGAVTSTSGGIGSTGSPQLYQWTRLGVTSWTVTVPVAGTYAVDVLICDTTNVAIGARVFSVSATDGTTTTVLAARLDPNAEVHGWHPYHVTGLVTLASTSLTVQFGTITGQPIVSGLAVSAAVLPSHVTLDQTFTGPAGAAPDSSVWSYQTGSGWEGSMGLETYTSARANSALDGNGDLAITARSTGSNTYTSARLITQNKFSFGYGTISARMQMPTGTGMWPAFWALGTDEPSVNWPSCGEIDVVEGLGTRPDVVAGHVHSLGNPGDPVGYLNQHVSTLGTDWTSAADTTAGFHTYSASYEPGYLTFSFDGHPYFQATPEDLLPGEAWPFTGASNYLVLDLAVGNSAWTGYTPVQPAGTAHTLLVDEITVTQ